MEKINYQELAPSSIILVYIVHVGYAVDMSKITLTLICLFLSVSLAAETVYKKTNPDGDVEFTDIPSTGSEKIKIRKPTTFSAPRLPALEPPAKKPKLIDYEVIIIEPVNDTTIIGNNEIKVSVSVSPVLPTSYKFRYQLGEQTLDSDSDSVSLDNIIRGTHTLRVSVINSKGEVVSAGASITFHMKRHFKRPPAPVKKPKVP